MLLLIVVVGCLTLSSAELPTSYQGLSSSLISGGHSSYPLGGLGGGSYGGGFRASHGIGSGSSLGSIGFGSTFTHDAGSSVDHGSLDGGDGGHEGHGGHGGHGGHEGHGSVDYSHGASIVGLSGHKGKTIDLTGHGHGHGHDGLYGGSFITSGKHSIGGGHGGSGGGHGGSGGGHGGKDLDGGHHSFEALAAAAEGYGGYGGSVQEGSSFHGYNLPYNPQSAAPITPHVGLSGYSSGGFKGLGASVTGGYGGGASYTVHSSH